VRALVAASASPVATKSDNGEVARPSCACTMYTTSCAPTPRPSANSTASVIGGLTKTVSLSMTGAREG
jgi:hypothetical protein